MKGKPLALLLCAGTIVLLVVRSALAGNVTGSKHDLSTVVTNEPCVFCHTPHQASTWINVPLWNRVIGPVTFTPYTSATMDTTPAATPNAYSLACLGCHDGTVAYFNGIDDKHKILNAPGSGAGSSAASCSRCHSFHGPPKKWLGLDLSNDHPISMEYPDTDPDFQTPPDVVRGWGGGSPDDVKLYGGNVECPSCHNVHDPEAVPFLRKSNGGSAICFTCHLK